jgi:hypothetical protein
VKKFNPALPVTTRDGHPARILATDLKNPAFPIAAVMTDEDGVEKEVCTFTAEGRFAHDGHERDADLVNPPAIKNLWLNITDAGRVYAYSDKDNALSVAKSGPLVYDAVAILFEYEAQ